MIPWKPCEVNGQKRSLTPGTAPKPGGRGGPHHSAGTYFSYGQMQWPKLSQAPREPPVPQSSDEVHAPLGGQNFGATAAGKENVKTEARTPARAVRRKAFF